MQEELTGGNTREIDINKGIFGNQDEDTANVEDKPGIE